MDEGSHDNAEDNIGNLATEDIEDMADGRVIDGDTGEYLVDMDTAGWTDGDWDRWAAANLGLIPEGERVRHFDPISM